EKWPERCGETAARSRCVPPPRWGGREGGGPCKKGGGMQQDSCVRAHPLPRKRGREQIEFAARADPIRARAEICAPRHPCSISDIRARPRACARLAGCFATRCVKPGNHRPTISTPSPCTHAATTSSVSSQVR